MLYMASPHLPTTDQLPDALESGTFTVSPVSENIMENFGNPRKLAQSSWIVPGPWFMGNLGTVTHQPLKIDQVTFSVAKLTNY